MSVAHLAAFLCYVAALLKAAGWFVTQSLPAAVALIAAGLALGLLAGAAVLLERR